MKVTSIKIVGLVALIAAASIAVYVLFRDNSGNDVNRQQPENQEADSAQNDTVRIYLTGDIIAHDSLNENAKTADGYDYLQFMEDFQPTFKRGDAVFCNQSTQIAGADFPITGYPYFNAPEELMRDISALGCTFVNTASNHSFDQSQEYLDKNVELWQNYPNVTAVGQNRNLEEKNDVHIIEVKGKKIAFLAYTTYSNETPPNEYGLNTYERNFAAGQIQKARGIGADYVLVSMRWGTEYSNEINDFQRREAQFLADQGVDIVVGHGPHVLQPVTRLQKPDNTGETLVWYSIGNFLNTQLNADNLFGAVGVVDINSDTGEVEPSYMPIYMHYEWTQAEKDADDLLARRNMRLVWLDDARELFEKSLLKSETSVDKQSARIDQVLNQETPIQLLDSE